MGFKIYTQKRQGMENALFRRQIPTGVSAIDGPLNSGVRAAHTSPMKPTPSDATLFANHLENVLAAIASTADSNRFDAVLIHAGKALPVFFDDSYYPFRANPWFNWLAPNQQAPDSLILIRNNKKPVLVFVSPEDYWHAPPQLPTDAWTKQFELLQVPSPAAAIAALPQLSANIAWIGEPAPPNLAWQHNPPRLLAQLEQFRCRKSAYEIACIREASRRGALGHEAAERAFRAGSSEFEIHFAFLAATQQTESELPYGSIVALNEHAATLHYQLRDRAAPTQSHSLLIDAGAGYLGYASDITRTWAARPGLFSDLVEGMHRLQQQLCAAVRPQLDWRDLHLETHRLVATLLQTAGVLKISAEAAVATGVSGTFLPHGLGHLLGLQVHDVAGFQDDADAAPIPRPTGHTSLRLTRRLQPDMVVTVEPGVYFIDSLLGRLRASKHAKTVNWDLVDLLRPCGGIRIEDNVVITATGHDNLTRTAFAARA
jgi:Xaa-Pro dipeptidase